MMHFQPVLTTHCLLFSRQFSQKQLFLLQQGAKQFAAGIDSTANILLFFRLQIQGNTHIQSIVLVT